MFYGKALATTVFFSYVFTDQNPVIFTVLKAFVFGNSLRKKQLPTDADFFL